MTKTLLICDCLGTQAVDAAALGVATGRQCSKLHTALCQSEIDVAAKAMAGGDVMIACQQEVPRFADLAEELGTEMPAFVDIRDRAGWTADTRDTAPKMAALVADAALGQPLPKTLDVVSDGVCLIVGGTEASFEAAEKLSDILAVTVLVPSAEDVRVVSGYDICVGRLHRTAGTLGQFHVSIDAFQQVLPGGRGAATLTAARDGAQSDCDVILDLSGETPLFPAHEKRDGYLRADPASLTAVADVILEASQMLGTFEKPLHIRLETQLCAHSRAEQPACSNCLNVCPTGAILPAGEHVTIDPLVCAGCGACSAVCPSGAISYDAPPVDHVFRRISALASTYRKAGGQGGVLLVHDAHGAEMIRLAARYGDGLPAHVIPMEIDALAMFGHAEMLAALATGFTGVDVVLAPQSDRDVLQAQAELAAAMGAADAVALLDIADPDALSAHLFARDVAGAQVTNPILPLGSRRQIARLSAKALSPEAETLSLPDHAPYGAVLVDTDACTLCLACVSLCPSGALVDNPDMPQLRFQEDACLQCGLCSNVCPEDAITLQPQMNLTDAALSQEVLNEEEPFACVECGSLFGVKSTVEKIMEKLAGNHAMFANSATSRMIQMCDNCRVQAQFHSQNNPFTGAERPAVRTTDDYLSKRKDH
ncbi:4Fe-4S binding protein [Litoreibacter albidus]|uniref:4Fe-4S dicluster domain-containing protein n=1 Tax=Litoreibacter albidus TaxID=670155 RepID=A0A1H2Z4E3_9RHOB|nr:4Fe-4S binding protein [Litoreibacter albidus]SDX12302.1 4Fe-4S dicluster domain-containing protein [Litoreibacter albidus]